MASVKRLLEAIGITSAEERVYRALLGAPPAAPAEAARLARLSRPETSTALANLQEKGLITRAPGRSVRFVAVSPEVALQALITERQRQIDRIQTHVQRLESQYRQRFPADSSAELVEVLDTPAVVAKRALHYAATARSEILVLDKPPYATSQEDCEPVGEQVLRKGVRVRVVYERASLAYGQGEGLRTARRFAALGEESRIFPEVPFKLSISDRRTALIPLAIETKGQIQGALLIHSSHLVDALVLLWELIWERGFPLAEIEDLDSSEQFSINEDERELVHLLMAGSKSEAISRQFGVALTTVERRIRRLMRKLGADTRFQAGFRVASMMLRPDSPSASTTSRPPA